MRVSKLREQLLATEPLVSPATTKTEAALDAKKPELEPDLAAIVDDVAAQIRRCRVFSFAWEVKAGQHLRDCRNQLPRGDWSIVLASGRLPVGERCAQVLARIAGNKALCSTALLERLPQSIAALNELAGLDAGLIEEGVRTGTLSAAMTIQDARIFVRLQSRGGVVPAGES